MKPEQKKSCVIVLGSAVVLAGLVAAAVAFMIWRGVWDRNKISGQQEQFVYSGVVKIDGRVVDQYDHLVPNAHVDISWGARDSEHKLVIADDQGRFHYDSSPRKLNSINFSIHEYVTDEGVFYSGAWINRYAEYDVRTGWPFDRVEKETGEKFTVPALRSGVPQAMILFDKELKGPMTESQTYGVNVLTGEVALDKCDDCDFTMIFWYCESGGRAIEVIAQSGGGVQFVIPTNLNTRGEIGEFEAPEDGYQNSAKVQIGACNKWKDEIHDPGNSKTPTFYFHSRNRLVYGSLLASPDDNKVHDTRGSIRIRANPRGERNLRFGISQIGFGVKPLPLPVTKLPYQDQIHFDLSKITAWEDKEKGLIYAKGEPGAAKGFRMFGLISPTNNARCTSINYEDKKDKDSDPYITECAGTSSDLIYLTGSYGGDNCYQKVDSCYEMVPFYKLKKKAPEDSHLVQPTSAHGVTEEANQKHGSSTP